MKLTSTSIVISVFVLCMTSCSKEDVETVTDNAINCTTNFQNHTNASTFQALLNEYAKNGFVGMTVLIDHPTDGQWMGSSGFAKLEENIEMNPCHLHHVASLYKTYIATIIMQMIEENKINLNSPLSEYLPIEIIERLPNGNDITIKNLLQQRTGLPDIFEEEFLTDFFNNPTKQYTILELLEYVYDKKPLSSIDSEFYYSDANFSLLTLVIEVIDGDFIQALKNRIFIPLELNDTYFLENNSQVPSGLTDSYWERFSDGNIENNTEVQIALATGLRGSDGIVTSADDLMTFIKALTEKEQVVYTN